MKTALRESFAPLLLVVLLSLAPQCFFAQTDNTQFSPPKSPNEFWRNVQFGGGLGLGFGSGYTDIMLAPSAIYNFNQYVSAGVGLSGSYVRFRNYSPNIEEFRSWTYGGSIIGLFHPIPQVQLSLELEQLRVNSTLETRTRETLHDNFWNTGLFVGAGYRMQNVTIGMRYNVLFNGDKTVYADAFMPFVRAYF